MKLGTHMPSGERRKPIDIEVCRSKALSIRPYVRNSAFAPFVALLIFLYIAFEIYF